jgi:hypothetical protein
VVVDGKEGAVSIDGASAATQGEGTMCSNCGPAVLLPRRTWRDYSAKQPSTQQNQIRLGSKVNSDMV